MQQSLKSVVMVHLQEHSGLFEFMNQQQIQLIIACILVVVVIGLLIAGFCVVPVGIIHSSILVAFGEVLTFVGAFVLAYACLKLYDEPVRKWLTDRFLKGKKK